MILGNRNNERNTKTSILCRQKSIKIQFKYGSFPEGI